MMRSSITDIRTAVRIYYQYPEIGSAEIRELFGGCANSTVAKLKKSAWDKMTENGVRNFGAHKVNTKCAYEAWGIDVDDLEKRVEKLKKLEFL